MFVHGGMYKNKQINKKILKDLHCVCAEMTYCTLNVVQTHRSFCLIFTTCTEVVYDVCVCSEF